MLAVLYFGGWPGRTLPTLSFVVFRPTVNKSEAYIRCVFAMRYLLRFYRPALLLILVALASSLFRPSYGQPTWCKSEGWLRFVRRTA